MRKPTHRIWILAVGIVLTGIIFSCGITQRTQAEQIFEVLKATRKQQFGGVMGSPSMVRYQVWLRAKKGGTFQFDSAWAEDYRFLAKQIMQSGDVAFKQFPLVTLKRGDTIALECPFEMAMPCENCPPPPTNQTFMHAAKVPMKGIFMVRFVHDKKERYLGVDRVENLENEYMP